MIFDLEQPITDFSILRNNYILRDGFVFKARNDNSNIFDVLLIRNTSFAERNIRRFPMSNHTLEEHIQLINDLRIERAEIIADDLEFVTKCPSLKEITIWPTLKEKNESYFLPLYKSLQIRSLRCNIEEYEKEKFCEIDYSQMCGLKDIGVFGKGHSNYHLVDTLEKLFISNTKDFEDVGQVCCSKKLKELMVIQCKVKTMNGIEKFKELQSLCLWHNRSLTDLSELSSIGDSLRLLSIEACPKIIDFSCLSELYNLEHLELKGSNLLQDLSFLKNMKKLKTFSFSMEVKSGDLTPCLEIPYVNCMKTRKRYNMKDRDLPKNIPMEPFDLN